MQYLLRTALLFVLVLFGMNSFGMERALADAPAQQQYQAMQAKYDQCIGRSNGGSGLKGSLDKVHLVTNGIAGASARAGIDIFKWLFAAEFAWWVIQTYRHSAARGFHIAELMSGVAFKVMTGMVFMGTIAWLGGLWNPGQPAPINNILTGFQTVALRSMQGAGVDNPLPNTLSGGADVGPDAIMQVGYCSAQFMLDSTAMGSTSNVSLFNMSGLLPVLIATLITFIAVLLVLLAFVVLAGQLYVGLIEAGMVCTAGLFVLGFTGSRWTLSYGQSIYKYIFSTGMKIFTCFIIAGFAQLLVSSTVQNTVQQLVANVPNLGQSVGGVYMGGMNLQQSLTFIAISILLILMAIRVPNLAGTFITGTPDMNIGQAVGVAAGVAALAAGGVKAAAGLRGAGGGPSPTNTISGPNSVPRQAPSSNNGGGGSRDRTMSDHINKTASRIGAMPHGAQHSSAPEIAIRHHE